MKLFKNPQTVCVLIFSVTHHLIGFPGNGFVFGQNDMLVDSIISSNPIPVSPSGFSGKANVCSVELSWTVDTEYNFSHYEIEWSGDGYHFQILKKVNGSNNLATQKTYHFVDESAAAQNYYRLKMVDQDGSFDYASVIFMETACEEGNEILVFPNPVQEQEGTIQVQFYSERAKAALLITDISGRIVRSINTDLNEQWNSISIDINGLPAGTYVIKQAGSKKAQTFVIQK